MNTGAAPTQSASSRTGAAIIHLVGAVLAEQTDEWTEQRRYMGTEILTKARMAAPRPGYIWNAPGEAALMSKALVVGV